MAKKQRPGFMLYHEDVDDLGMLEAEEFKRLFLALARFSETGETETLGGGLDVLYRLMMRKISKQDEAYERTCQARREAAEKRWNVSDDDANDANACNSMQTDANDANRNLNLNLNMNLSPQNIEKQSVTRAREDVETEADDAIRDRCVRKLQEAGEKGDPFLEDGITMLIGRHGPAKVERAVDRAVSDRSPNIQDVRNILLSWERTDEARDAFDGFSRDDDTGDREAKKA